MTSSSSSKPHVGLLVGSTRQGRSSGLPADWMLACCRTEALFETEWIDLRDYPMPWFNDDMAPSARPSQEPLARRWTALLERLDGLVVITPEYNHGPPAVLKNAFDHVAGELVRKPIAFVGYGEVGAARAIEQLRLMAIELDMVPLRAAVHIGVQEMAAAHRQERPLGDDPRLAQQALRLVRHVGWWADLLSAHRRRVEEHTPG